MICAQCHTEIANEKKFCHECGNPLPQPCPACGAVALAADKFCGECGSPLGSFPPGKDRELSFDEKLTRLQRYLPQGLTAKILAQKDKIEGERKQVTVMFCDLSGSTALGEKLGSEEIYSFMDQFFEILIHKVHEFGGTVNKMTGDGIMALFGAPIAVEGAPQRAIRSALAISREMTRFSDQIRETKRIPPLKMRVGIHTGTVVVGSLGNDLRVEFNAVGDTVNLASRMEGLAEPGMIYVTEETFQLTDGLFRFESLGEKKVKGKEQPVRVYRVIGASEHQTRFDVSAERGLTPFIGRDRELELLLDGLARCKEGKGQAFSIVAEAGLGKSRLLYELRKAVASEDLAFIEGRCLAYRRGAAYFPVVEVLKSIFDLDSGEEQREAREKMARGLRRLKIQEDPNLPFLLQLLGMAESGIDKVPMSPDARKDRILNTLKQIFFQGCEDRPLILAVEDLQWIDQSSEDTLKAILEAIPGMRLFLICTFRPEYIPSWGSKSFHNQITLNRLSNRESLAMISHLLGGGTIDSTLEEMILEKTEGVPFFIEEFIRSWKDLKVIQFDGHAYHLGNHFQNWAIPSTIQEVIMARVDALPERAKEILKIGSVIEREFGHELIRKIANLPESELLTQISILKDAELLYERGIYPQTSYVFRHALTREVIYDSLLSPKKKTLHEAIGKAMEESYASHLGEYGDILTEHFIQSENFAKGAEYARRAAKGARGKSVYNDAINYAKKEVSCLERLPQTEANRQRILEARTALANYCMNLNDHAEAKEAISPILERVRESKDPRALSTLYTVLGSHSVFVEEDHLQGREYLSEVLRIAEQAKDYFSFWNACYILGCSLSWNCEFEKAQEYFYKSLDLSLAAQNIMGITSAQINLGMNYIFQGKIAPAYRISQESLRLAEESGDIYLKGMAQAFHGTSCYYRGDSEEAENHLRKGISYCEKTTHFTWGAWASAFLGDMYFDLEKPEKAQEAYRKALSFLGDKKFSPSWRNLLGVAIVRAGLQNRPAGWSGEDLAKSFAENKNKGFSGWIAQYIAEILLHGGDRNIQEAEAWANKSLSHHRENGMRLLLGRDYLLHAELQKRQGNFSMAKEHLNQALEIFQECGAKGYLQKAKREWIQLTSLSYGE